MALFTRNADEGPEKRATPDHGSRGSQGPEPVRYRGLCQEGRQERPGIGRTVQVPQIDSERLKQQIGLGEVISPPGSQLEGRGGQKPLGPEPAGCSYHDLAVQLGAMRGW